MLKYMKINKILIVLGEPQSTFSEILFKYFNSKEFSKNNKKIILIGCRSLIQKQMKKLKFNLNLKEIYNLKEAKIERLNILNVNYNNKKVFSKMSSDSKKYISDCFNNVSLVSRITDKATSRFRGVSSWS